MTEGPFLRRVLRGRTNARVFDGGSALGCEAALLTKAGFKVVANEIDSRLARRARSTLEAMKLSIEMTAIDWRDLRTTFAEKSFDVCLLIGNSLGLLSRVEDRHLAVSNMFELLKPGGMFIVDQRNYEYMFSQRDAVLGGSFQYSGRVMYCERAIVGRPTIIEAERVRMSCFDKYTGRALGHFDVHPFREGELRGLLQHCGFEGLDEFFDFRERAAEHWDFQTMVARKPL